MTPEKEKDQANAKLSLFPFQLMDVRLFEARIVRRDLEDLDEDDLEPAVNVMVGSEPVDAEEFRVLVGFKAGLPPGEDPSCYLELSVEGQFKSVVASNNLKEDIVERFRQNDALVLLWPYLREFLQNISTKMRLEMAPLPIIDPSAMTLNTIAEEEDA